MKAPVLAPFLLSGALLACTAATPRASLPALSSIDARKSCGDFLARTGRKPAHVSFAGCSYAPDRQGKPLRATYHVQGSHAAAAEAALIRTTGMRRIARACCQWDTQVAQFRVNGIAYSITMVSPETSVARREDWAEIGRFDIVVETLTEEI